MSISIAALLGGCSRFIDHEASNQYESTEQDGGAFTASIATSDPKPYEGSRVAKVHLDENPGSGTKARGALTLNPPNSYGFYGGAFYFPPGTLNGPSPKQQLDLDVVRWDYGNEAEYGGLRIGSDHQVRLIRGQSGQPVDSIGMPFSFQEGCWNWVAVVQKLSSDSQQRINQVYLNGQQVVNASSDPNSYGHNAEKVRFGAAYSGTGPQEALDFYMDKTFISNDPLPAPTANACDPIFGGATPSTVPLSSQTPLSEATKFLYEGDFPLQSGVAPGTIKEERAAVLHGKVLDRQGQPMESVRASVPDHPEFGSMVTREDGKYYLAVNGGGELRVRFEREGFLPIERPLNVSWQEYELTEDVVLTPLDDQETSIDLSATGMQVARANEVSDGDGARQATLLFPEDATATMTVGGSTQPLTDLTVRATEYTVGPEGPEAMPAELPPTSAYTYAVEYSVDQALEAGATDVTFSESVISYTDNFLGFPVGEDIPAGHYDKAGGAWVPADTTAPADRGLVVEIHSESGGVAELDLDGSGQATQAQLDQRGITLAERQKLSELYDPGKTLWRVPVKHFSPWDYNWPFGPPPGAAGPIGEPSFPGGLNADCITQGSSTIECEDQVLGEHLDVVGSDFGLNYTSERARGREADDEIEIPLTGNTLPPGLKRVELAIEIAGKRLTPGPFPAQTSQSYTFNWDGEDVFGRKLQGSHPVRVGIGYVYDGSYERTMRFGYTGNGLITGSETRREVTLWSYHKGTVGSWDAQGQGLGAWSLDVHHVYDPDSQILYRGDGSRYSAQDVSRVVNRVAGGGGNDTGDGIPARDASLGGVGISGVAAAPDGSFYVSEPARHIVRRVSPDGIITRVAGTGVAGTDGDLGQARDAKLNRPLGLDVGPDGSLYIADGVDLRIRRVYPDGKIDTVAGGASGENTGDGGPAKQAGLQEPLDVAVASDGTFYISAYRRLRKVDPSGTITTAFVSQQAQHGIYGIDVAPDGSPYIVDGPTIKRLGPDGTVKTLAGQDYGDAGEGGPATDALIRPYDVAAAADHSFYIVDLPPNRKVKFVSTEGIITTVGGNGQGLGQAGDFSPDGTPARKALIDYPYGISLAADGAVLVLDNGGSRVLSLASPLPAFSGDDIAIPSEDGSELYKFNKQGRHLQTLDALTGAPLYTFGYMPSGLLETVTDGDGNVTRIERNGAGDPTGILAPFGEHVEGGQTVRGARTSLTIDPNGYLETVTNPENETWQLDHDGQGLLRSTTDPRSGTSNYAYDSGGRLERADDRGNGYKKLARMPIDRGSRTTVQTKLGEELGTAQTKKTYETKRAANGDLERTFTDEAGVSSTQTTRQDGSVESTAADGTETTIFRGPDARFGMNAAILTSLATDTPDGRQLRLTGARQVTLSDPPNPLSLQTQTDTLQVNGRTYTTAYSASQRRFTTTSPRNRTSTLEIDDQGRTTRQTATDLYPISTTYMSDGRVETEKHGPDGNPSQQRVWSYTYEDPPSADSTGFLDTVTDPIGRETSFDYDAAGRVKTQSRPGGRVITYDYDDNGNLASITPPSRPAHTFGYSAVDQITGYTPPDLIFSPRETIYTYNDDQQLELIDRPDDKDVNFEYETATHRLDFFDMPSGRTELSYSSLTGNLSSLSAPSAQAGGEQLALSYDGSLPKRETFSGTVSGSVSRTYDDDLRLDTASVNDAHMVDYAYDDDGLVIQAGALTLGRDAGNGLLRSTTLGQVTTSITPNAFGEVQSESASHGSTQLYSATYTLDALGRIAQKTETTSQGTHTFTYTYQPQTGFLTDVHEGAQEIAHYEYDANGIRTLRRRDGVEVTTDRDAQDRLTRQGATDYTYSKAGDLETKTVGGNTTSYSYDPLGALEHVTLPSGTQLDYVNDGLGRRIAKNRDGSLEQGFLYGTEAPGPVAELDSSGDLRSRFVYASRSSTPDYMTRGGNTYRILTDQLGSPRIIVDSSSGHVAQEMDYDEYGRVVRDTNPGFQPFGFGGGLYDGDIRLVRFAARDYDSELGRWTTKDPISFAGGDTNLYGYVLEDPVNLLDPSGLSLIEWAPDPIQTPIDKATGAVAGGVKSAYETATAPAQSALEYYASVADDPCSSFLETVGGWAGGSLSALATEENAWKTALTLAGGYTGGGYAGGARYIVAKHGAHHRFPIVGKRPHMQVTKYIKGKAGSDKHVRLPLP